MSCVLSSRSQSSEAQRCGVARAPSRRATGASTRRRTAAGSALRSVSWTIERVDPGQPVEPRLEVLGLAGGLDDRPDRDRRPDRQHLRHPVGVGAHRGVDRDDRHRAGGGGVLTAVDRGVDRGDPAALRARGRRGRRGWPTARGRGPGAGRRPATGRRAASRRPGRRRTGPRRRRWAARAPSGAAGPARGSAPRRCRARRRRRRRSRRAARAGRRAATSRSATSPVATGGGGRGRRGSLGGRSRPARTVLGQLGQLPGSTMQRRHGQLGSRSPARRDAGDGGRDRCADGDRRRRGRVDGAGQRRSAPTPRLDGGGRPARLGGGPTRAGRSGARTAPAAPADGRDHGSPAAAGAARAAA